MKWSKQPRLTEWSHCRAETIFVSTHCVFISLSAVCWVKGQQVNKKVLHIVANNHISDCLNKVLCFYWWFERFLLCAETDHVRL